MFQINSVPFNFLFILKQMYQKFHIEHSSINRNVSWAPNEHRMISEGACDPEDWRNDNENSTLHHRNQ